MAEFPMKIKTKQKKTSEDFAKVLITLKDYTNCREMRADSTQLD